MSAAEKFNSLLAPIALGYVAVRDRGWRDLTRVVVVMPFYWLAVSWAAYRALFELAHDPFHWEKTEHGARPVSDQLTN
jgi:hypothetical protein